MPTQYKKYKIRRKAFSSRGPEETRNIETLEYAFPCKVAEEQVGVGLPVTCTIYNVMGQEDIFRHIEDQREFNFLTGRIVVTTGVPANIEIKYSANDLDLDQTTGLIETDDPGLYHEVFIPNLIVDSLYAFTITATVRNIEGDENDYEALCTDPIVSDIYYFTTGGTVEVGEPSFESVIFLSKPTIPESVCQFPPTAFAIGISSIGFSVVSSSCSSESIVPLSRQSVINSTKIYTSATIITPP
jgi:hypothetical protein